MAVRIVVWYNVGMKYVRLLATAAVAAPCCALWGTNPVFTDTFTADPAPIVVGDTCYVVTTQDENDGTPGQWLIMNNWRLYSSKDLKSWTSHGVVMDWRTYKWGASDSWASQMVKGGDGRFYHYTTLVGRGDLGFGCRCTGVAVADSPVGPWKDAIGKPLIKDSDTPSPYGWDDIDPTVFIDDDGTPWMAWGNPVCYLAKLKKNMVELDGEIKTLAFPNYTEGPWLFKRKGLYYLLYVSHNHLGYGEKVSYATAKSMEGPWTHRGLICENPGFDSYGIHPGVCEFNGQWLFFYFNDRLQLPSGLHGNSNRRSVCADYLYFNPDGTIRPIEMTKEGLEGNPKAAAEIARTFKPVPAPKTGCRGKSAAFSQPGVVDTWKSFEEMRALTWRPGTIATTGGSKLYYDFPEYVTHRNSWNGSETLGQTFKIDRDVAVEKIALFVGGGDGTDAETPLSVELYDLGAGKGAADETYAHSGADLLGGDVSLDYVPCFRGQAELSFAKGKGPKLLAGHTYVLELKAKRKTSPITWFGSRYDRDVYPDGAAYRDGRRIANDKGRTIDMGLAVYGTPFANGR